MAQNPWDNDEIVSAPQQQPAPQGSPIFSETRSSYTNESPEELIAQGYTQKPDGNWERVESVQLSEEDLTNAGFAPNPQTGRWEPPSSDKPITESQLRANEAAARDRDGGMAGTGWGNATRGLNNVTEQIYQGALLGGADELDWLAGYAKQAPVNAYRTLIGQPVDFTAREYADARMNLTRDRNREFQQEHPVASFGLNVFGGGGIGAAGGARSAAPSLLTASTVGAGTGAVAGGLSADGDILDRALGAGAGGVIGGVLPSGVAAASVPVRSTLSAGQRVVSLFGNRAGRVVRAGGNVTPEQSAATRLSQFVTDDARAAEAQRASLGLRTSPIDVLGGTAERRVRAAAAPAGPAAEFAVEELGRRSSNLKPDVMGDVRGWLMSPETADQAVTRLTQRRSELADVQYRPAYQERVQIPEDVRLALGDEFGRAALRRAERGAAARQDMEQLADIQALLNGSTDEVSAGALDRIRIAMGGRAQRMNQSPDTRDIASGLFQREGVIDAALDDVPALAPARQNYRELSQAIDAAGNPQGFMTAEPSTFRANYEALPDVAQQAAIQGERQVVLDTLGAQRDAGVGYLQNMTQGDYPRQNLATMLGEDAAGRFTDRVNLRIGDAQRAARISPNTNSQTFGRALDEQQFNAAEAVGAVTDVARSATGDVPAIARVFDRIRGRMAMGPEDREAVVRLAMDSGRSLDDIVALAEQARAAGRPPPREVRRFIDQVRGSFGRSSPAAIDIEKLLLPSPVAAEETQEQPSQ